MPTIARAGLAALLMWLLAAPAQAQVSRLPMDVQQVLATLGPKWGSAIRENIEATAAAFRPLLKARLLELAPTLIAELRLTPFEVSKVELELVAHGDGAFYKRHIDTATARDAAHLRVLSGVYYLHREPRAFSGGALRLYAIGNNARFVDIEPVCNALLVFPAWAPHEVLPVSVPSGRFADARFAINCWLKQRRTV